MENNLTPELKLQFEQIINNMPQEGEFTLPWLCELMVKARDMDRWVDVKERLPEIGDKVWAALQHWNTKNYRYHELKRVAEDDCDWRTVDDNSEISYDWTVTHYQPLPNPRWTHFKHGEDFNKAKERLRLCKNKLEEFLRDENMCPFH